MKLFSPSLDMRSEPPNSRAVVMRVDGKMALVQFRGQLYQARMGDTDIVAGESVAFIESPRYSYWIKRNGPSWYANPLKNWFAKGHKAQAALEYFLRKNPKWSPYMIIEGDDGEPTLIETPGKSPILDDDGGLLSNVLGDFDTFDTDGDGFISFEEFQAAGGGDRELFDELDKNRDGKISREEWEQRTHKGGQRGDRLFQDRTGAGEPPEDPWSPWIDPITPPTGFSLPDENSWYGFTQCLPAPPLYGLDPTDVTQENNDGITSTSGGNTIYPEFEIPSLPYFYNPEPLALAKITAALQDGLFRVYIKGAAGTSTNKRTFDKMRCVVAGGNCSLPLDAEDYEWETYQTTKAGVNAAAAAAAAGMNARQPKLIIVQNGAEPVYFNVTVTVATSDNSVGGWTYHNVSAEAVISA